MAERIEPGRVEVWPVAQARTVLSETMYAAINASGKNGNRAGQKAIATHTIMKRTDQSHISDLRLGVYTCRSRDYRLEHVRLRHADRTNFGAIPRITASLRFGLMELRNLVSRLTRDLAASAPA